MEYAKFFSIITAYDVSPLWIVMLITILGSFLFLILRNVFSCVSREHIVLKKYLFLLGQQIMTLPQSLKYHKGRLKDKGINLSNKS